MRKSTRQIKKEVPDTPGSSDNPFEIPDEDFDDEPETSDPASLMKKMDMALGLNPGHWTAGADIQPLFEPDTDNSSREQSLNPSTSRTPRKTRKKVVVDADFMNCNFCGRPIQTNFGKYKISRSLGLHAFLHMNWRPYRCTVCNHQAKQHVGISSRKCPDHRKRKKREEGSDAEMPGVKRSIEIAGFRCEYTMPSGMQDPPMAFPQPLFPQLQELYDVPTTSHEDVKPEVIKDLRPCEECKQLRGKLAEKEAEIEDLKQRLAIADALQQNRGNEAHEQLLCENRELKRKQEKFFTHIGELSTQNRFLSDEVDGLMERLSRSEGRS
ncbi:unnamed protein product, partial [Mesorhabditis spiculigera]